MPLCPAPHARAYPLAAGLALLALAAPPAHAQAVSAPGQTPAAATAVELTVVGGSELNPNAEGRASPVVVRIYELAAAPAFEAAAFTALFEHPAEALRSDLLAQEEFVLRPGEIQQHDRAALAPRVQALGVVAAFRELDRAVWHLLVPVKSGRRNFLLVDLDRNTIRLVPVD
jgi:type VI secretion system protein VasD